MEHKPFSQLIREGCQLHASSAPGTWSDADPETGKFRACAIVAGLAAAAMIETRDGSPGAFDFKDGPGITKTFYLDHRSGNFGHGSRLEIAETPWAGVLLRTGERPDRHCRCERIEFASGASCSVAEAEVNVVIQHLHDHHALSREAVAEWLETVEKKIDRENLNRRVLEQVKDENKALRHQLVESAA